MAHSYKKFWTAALVLAALLGSLAGNGPHSLAQPLAPPADTGDGTLLEGGQPAPWDVVPEPVSRPPSGDLAAAAASDCQGPPSRQVRYTTDGVIHVEGCGQAWTLTEVFAALPPMIRVDAVTNELRPRTEALELVDPAGKIWLLKVKLKVEEGATLNVVGGAAGDASVLRLFSATTSAAPQNVAKASGIWLRADNGNLRFESTTVTSWDPSVNGPDTDYSVDNPATPANEGSGAGRSYIAARSVVDRDRYPGTVAPAACTFDGSRYNGGPATQGGAQQQFYEARMDVLNSTITDLGYYGSEAYGIVWKVYYNSADGDPSDQPPANRALYDTVDIFGDVVDSTLTRNYFGTYTFGAYCMNFLGNVYDGNVKYGLDPHDDSDFLAIDRNTFRFNGSHGVICSQFCNDLRITNNRAHDNVGTANSDETTVPYTHGIMLHRSVTNTLVAHNESYNNNGGGIAVFESYNNVIRDNRVHDNGQAGLRLSVGAHSNLFENNTVTGATTQPGYVIYTYKGSDQPATTDGLIRGNVFRTNTFSATRTPAIRMQDGPGNVFDANTLTAPGVDFELSGASEGVVLRTTSSALAGYQLAIDAGSSIAVEASSLTAGACYRITANGDEVARARAQQSGWLSFGYAGSGRTPLSFGLTTATGCNSQVRLPYVVNP